MSDELAARLRAAGLRHTSQRAAVVEALAGSDGHATPESLAARLQETYPGLNASTVYRTLQVLEELSIAEHVHLGHGSSEWKLLPPEGTPHHHLYCVRCGWTAPLAGDDLRAVEDLLAPLGVAALSRHFGVSVVCARCGEHGEAVPQR